MLRLVSEENFNGDIVEIAIGGKMDGPYAHVRCARKRV